MLEILASVSSLPVAYLFTRYLKGYLMEKGMTVPDAHKEGKPPVARPGGPAILVASLAALLLIYLLNQQAMIISFMLVLSISFLVGLVDDLRSLSGPTKVILLLLSPLPILLLHTYSPFPPFPFSGHLRLTDVYPLLVLVAIPVSSNTFNMIDIYNGLVSGFSIIAFVPLVVDFALTGQAVPLAMALAVLLSVAGFYPFHRYPSKVFPGDSGTLAIGAAYGALAIMGHAEIVAIVALLPSVLNSFFVISSVGGFIEHKEMKKRPVRLREDFMLEASREKDAPVTLARMLLADGPLSERQLSARVMLLEGYSSVLAIITLILILVT